MNKRDELIEKYASDLREKCTVIPDIALLRKVTIGCGPSIYNKDSRLVSGTDESELDTVRNNFLIKNPIITLSGNGIAALLDNKIVRFSSDIKELICNSFFFICAFLPQYCPIGNNIKYSA